MGDWLALTKFSKTCFNYFLYLLKIFYRIGILQHTRQCDSYRGWNALMKATGKKRERQSFTYLWSTTLQQSVHLRLVYRISMIRVAESQTINQKDFWYYLNQGTVISIFFWGHLSWLKLWVVLLSRNCKTIRMRYSFPFIYSFAH